MSIDFSNIQNPLYKPFKLIGYKTKQLSFLQRHVVWIKTDHGNYNCLIKILKIVELIFAAVSLVGIPLIIKAYKFSSRIDAEKKFKQAVESVNPPDPAIKIETKSATRTFTNTHEIIIENNFLWGRHRHSNKPWTPLYFDGFIDHKIPQLVHADGANLCVIDQYNDVHYKKLIREYRSSEITPKNKRAQEFIEGTDVDLAKDQYIVIDKMHKNNWKERWFTLPVLRLATPFLKLPKKLKLPENYLAVAISHRGRYNDYLEDDSGAQHPVEEGVTTLYVLMTDGKVIHKFDPWSPRIAKMNLHVPETSHSSFRAINMDVAASHLMLIGYETTLNPQGEGVQHKLSIKTKLADIDSQGWNPGLKFDYFPHTKNPRVRLIGNTPWLEHPLQLKEGEKISKEISIIQTGEGNAAREMRIEGWNAKGETGYFYKMINDSAWNFKPMDSITAQKSLEIEINEKEGTLQSSVFDYHSLSVKFRGLNNSIQPEVSLKDFGAGNTDSILNIETEDKTYSLRLHRKKNLKNFIGIEGDSYDLVIPVELHQDEYIKRLFHEKKSLSVQIRQNKNTLSLQSKQFSLNFEKI